MKRQETTQSRIVNVLRWIARIGSGLLAIGLGVMGAYGLQGAVWSRMDTQQMLTFGFIALAIVALIIAWFWEFLGGALLLAIGLAIFGMEVSGGVVDGGPFAFAILGVMFLYCWWASRRQAHIPRTA